MLICRQFEKTEVLNMDEERYDELYQTLFSSTSEEINSENSITVSSIANFWSEVFRRIPCGIKFGPSIDTSRYVVHDGYVFGTLNTEVKRGKKRTL